MTGRFELIGERPRRGHAHLRELLRPARRQGRGAFLRLRVRRRASLQSRFSLRRALARRSSRSVRRRTAGRRRADSLSRRPRRRDRFSAAAVRHPGLGLRRLLGSARAAVALSRSLLVAGAGPHLPPDPGGRHHRVGRGSTRGLPCARPHVVRRVLPGRGRRSPRRGLRGRGVARCGRRSLGRRSCLSQPPQASATSRLPPTFCSSTSRSSS